MTTRMASSLSASASWKTCSRTSRCAACSTTPVRARRRDRLRRGGEDEHACRDAALDGAVLAAHVVAAEEVLLDLEDRRPALVRVEAVHGAARVRSAVKLGEEAALTAIRTRAIPIQVRCHTTKVWTGANVFFSQPNPAQT